MHDPFGINDIYLEAECSHPGCIQPAVEQEWVNRPLCREHVGWEIEWSKADEHRDRIWEDAYERRQVL